jgi:hypothetical protein
MNFYDLIKLFNMCKINKKQEVINLFTNELNCYNIEIYKDDSETFIHINDKDYNYHNQETRFKKFIFYNNIKGIEHLIYGHYEINNFDLFYDDIISTIRELNNDFDI